MLKDSPHREGAPAYVILVDPFEYLPSTKESVMSRNPARHIVMPSGRSGEVATHVGFGFPEPSYGMLD